MTPSQREQIVELLELSHGYALLGSIMPFKTACVELGLVASEVAREAAEVIDRARNELRELRGELWVSDKPTKERYTEAIGMALERVEAGDWL